MPYIERYTGGGIAIFAHRQEGIAEEFVPEDDPILVGKGQTIKQARQALLTKVRDHATQLRALVTSQCSPQEAAAWVIKREEVKAYRVNPVPESAPLLAEESAFREIPLTQLIDLVEAKSQAFLRFEARISGTRAYHEDQIDKLNTVEALVAYDWQSRWSNKQN